jgi:TIR domain-containing protein
MAQPVVFISYSHKDGMEKDELETHLRGLQYNGAIESWDDDHTAAGGSWEEEIYAAIDRANVAILLITKDFLASTFIIENEVPRVLNRLANEDLKVFPIIAKPCAWKKIGWLRRLKVRPKNGVPIWSPGSHPETVLAEITEELATFVQNMSVEKANPSQPPTSSPMALQLTGLPKPPPLRLRIHLSWKEWRWYLLAACVVFFCAWASILYFTVSEYSDTWPKSSDPWPVKPLTIHLSSPKFLSPGEDEEIRLAIQNFQDGDIESVLFRLENDPAVRCILGIGADNRFYAGPVQGRSHVNRGLRICFLWGRDQPNRSLGGAAGLSLWAGKDNPSAILIAALPIRIGPLPCAKRVRGYMNKVLFALVIAMAVVVAYRVTNPGLR